MQDHGQTTHSATRLVLLAFGLAVVMAVELVAGNGFMRTLLAGELPWQPILMIALMILTAMTAIINAFTATIRPDPARTHATLASCALALTVGLETSHIISALPLQFYFWTTLAGHAIFTYCFGSSLVGLIRLTGKWATIPPRVATVAVLLTGALGFIGQSWISLAKVTMTVALVRDLSLVALPSALLLATSFVRPLRLDSSSAMQSFLLRLPRSPEERPRLRALVASTLGLVACVVLDLTLQGLDSARETAALATFSWGWLGMAYLAVSELRQLTGEQRQGNVTAKLATTPARRFLKRHLTEQTAWAATAGLKTTNFIIDHDPGSLMHTELPASIMQIRSEEISRCVSEVLGPMFLHSHLVGARIFGAVDPETAIRPCIDTLRMFACLYLDAGPLVERRIKGLTALLPIVDPGLARVMKTKDISSLIRRNLWFFHFDFGWIDQHVIHTPRQTRYDVRLATLGSRVRHSMMEHLEKTGGVGNFVWLGPDARDRLLQEAPAMRNIIEACPIVVEDIGSSDETLMFIIKFEQLIPRLQRYFDLDSMRRALLDFEPSHESVRLQNLLGLQIAKTRDVSEIAEILASITSVPWRGFREKDNALHLILAAYEQLIRISGRKDDLFTTDDPKPQALHERLIEAVRAIGYPSQILHNAQISKIALRDVDTLAKVASDPRHPRFSEAWLLLATTDYQRHSADQRRAILEFLAKVPSIPRLACQALVQVKAVDALASLGRTLRIEERPVLARVSTSFADWYADYEVDPDICCLFLDAQMFLKAHLGEGVELPAAAISRLDGYFQALTGTLGASSPKVIGIMSRWQEVRARQITAASAA